MTDDRRVPGQIKLPLTPAKLELRRLLLEQCSEDSVDRHGIDNRPVRILSRLLVPAVPPTAAKRLYDSPACRAATALYRTRRYP
jgi:hypothetical protein